MSKAILINARVVFALANITIVSLFIPNMARAEEAAEIRCALLSKMADTQAPAARDVAREARDLSTNKTIRMKEPEAQAAFERLQQVAERTQAALDEFARAFEEVQIETTKCRIRENQTK